MTKIPVIIGMTLDRLTALLVTSLTESLKGDLKNKNNSESDSRELLDYRRAVSCEKHFSSRLAQAYRGACDPYK